METVSLVRIVMKCTPEMYASLKKEELEVQIVLRDGLDKLGPEDALDIIRHSICEHQKEYLLH